MSMQIEINQLNKLITESQELLKKLRKILNTMIIIASIIFIPFLYSFVEVQVKLSKLEGTVEKIEPVDFYYNKFVQKVDALAVHMYEYQWINTQLYKITSDEEYKNSEARKILIEAMFNENSRGK